MTAPRAILIDQPGEPLVLRVIGPGLDHMVPLTDASLARLLSDVAPLFRFGFNGLEVGPGFQSSKK